MLSNFKPIKVGLNVFFAIVLCGYLGVLFYEWGVIGFRMWTASLIIYFVHMRVCMYAYTYMTSHLAVIYRTPRGHKRPRFDSISCLWLLLLSTALPSLVDFLPFKFLLRAVINEIFFFSDCGDFGEITQ